MLYELRRPNHAIGQFTAQLTFFQPVNATTFANVVSLTKAAADDLGMPAPMNMQVVTVDLSMSNAHANVSDGIGRQAFAPTGEVARSIFCDRDSIAFTSRDYTTWQQMLPIILRLFEGIGVAYISEVPALKSISILYSNEFRSFAAGYPEKIDLFRENSKWLPRFICDCRDAWHSHMAYYEEEDHNFRRLVSVNLTSLMVQMTDRIGNVNVVNAAIQIGQNYDIPAKSPLIVDKDSFSGVILKNLNSAHDREKEVVKELFSQSYLVAMGAAE